MNDLQYAFDRTLFEYLTMKAGFSLDEAAAAMGLSSRSLLRRRKGEITFKLGEVLKWCDLVKSEGSRDVLIRHVFFRNTQGNTQGNIA